jgi:hypothetical protein
MPRPKKTIAQRERERRTQKRKARLDAALATTLETRRADPYNLASWDTGGTKSHHATKKTSTQLDREIAEVLTGAGSSSPFEAAKAEQAQIEQEVDTASAALRVFPRGPMGLTADAVTAMPEYRAAKTRYAKAFARQRAFNEGFTKKFAKELRTERDKRYGR